MALPQTPDLLLKQLIDAAWQTAGRHKIPLDDMMGALACAVLLHNDPPHHNDPELLLANILTSTPEIQRSHNIPIVDLIGMLFCALSLRDDPAKATPRAPHPHPPKPRRKKQPPTAGPLPAILPSRKVRRRRLTTA